MLRFDNIGSMTVHASGTMPAAGGTFSTTAIDFSKCEGNVLVSFSANGAGTGTLDLVAQQGTALVSTWTNIGTDAMFLADTGAGTQFTRVIAGTNIDQKRAIALDKVQPFIRFTGTGTDSSYRYTIVTIAPSKYANFGV
jgi:hypothetical protein